MQMGRSAMQKLEDAYMHLVMHRVPGPRSLSYFVPFILLPLALMISPARLSRPWLACLFTPPIVASSIHAWLAMGGVDVISTDMVLWCCYLIWFEDVRVVYKRVRRVEDNQQKQTLTNGDVAVGEIKRPEGNGRLLKNDQAPAAGQRHDRQEAQSITVQTYDELYPKDPLTRLHWILTLMASIRMNGWKTGSSRHDNAQAHPSPHPTRWQFWLRTVPQQLTSICLLSLTTLIAKHDPYFYDAGRLALNTPYPRYLPANVPFITRMLLITTRTIPPRILRPLSFGLGAYSILTMQYCIPAPLAVLTNYLFHFPSDAWSPHTNGRYFGPFSSVLDHGVSGIWGKWWHDQMKVMTSGPGIALGRALGWRGEGRRTNAKAYGLQVASAFFFSGVVHMGLVPPQPLYTISRTPMQLRWHIAAFFWVQGLGVLIELCVAMVFRIREHTMARKFGMRILRLTWAVTWLCLTIPLLAVPFAELGYWQLVPPGFPFHRIL